MAESLRGHILIASVGLRDPNFFKTVVLMVEHGDKGAMGLVVNRPSKVSVQQALEKHFALPETDECVHIGGPVEQNALFILHNLAQFDGGEEPLLPGLFVGHSAEVFHDVVEKVAEGQLSVHFRVFAGCAGWAPDQLEGELARGDWHVRPASGDIIFQADPYSLWDSQFRKVREEHRLFPDLSGNPELN